MLFALFTQCFHDLFGILACLQQLQAAINLGFQAHRFSEKGKVDAFDHEEHTNEN